METGEIMNKILEMEKNKRIENKIDDFQKEFNGVKEKIFNLEMENGVMREKVKKQEEKIIQIKKEPRKKNIVIQGIEEEEEDDSYLRTKVNGIFGKLKKCLYC